MTTDVASRPNLLAELDARQNEVLHQLDELNRRVESLLAQWTSPAVSVLSTH